MRPPSLKHRWLPRCELAKQYRATDPRTGGLQPKKCSTFRASLVPSGAETQEECKEVLPSILDIRQLAKLHKFESILSTQQHVKHLLLSFLSRLVAILQFIDASTRRAINLTNKTS